MLSRVANSLYWMARYIERAENIARIVDVNLQLLLDLRNLDEKRSRHWLPIVQATGDEEGIFQAAPARHRAGRHGVSGVPAGESELHRLSPSVQARENARMVRDQITLELWEELNRLYLFVRSPQARKSGGAAPANFSRRSRPARCSHRPALRHADSQRRLVVRAGRQVSRTRRQDHAHPRRAPQTCRNAACRKPSARPTRSNGRRCCARAARGTPTNPFTAPTCSPRLVAEFLCSTRIFRARSAFAWAN
jgi:hypothetical protein